MNCETDFVAKNENFQSLLSTVTHTLLDQPQTTSPSSVTTTFYNSEGLSKLTSASSTSLGDTLAGSVGQLGENLVLQRGCLLTSNEGGVVCGYVYNNTTPHSNLVMGKYAAMVHLSPTNEAFADQGAIEKLGGDIGQHIIGVSPLVVNEGDMNINDPTKVLTKQSFVLDEDVNVGDMLTKQSAQVTEFVRYAVGEN